MVRKNLKVTVCAFMVGILFAISTTLVFAATAYSPWGYYGPYLGYSYKNRAMVSDDYRLLADTTVANQVSGNIPTGYMGALARLWKDGVLVASTDWYYNGFPCNSISTATPDGSFSSGTYYSKGLSSAYNGSGYTVYYTFQSPSINH